MSIIIRYQVKFPEAGFAVSNDLSLGDFVLDASITIEMVRGTAGTSFEIKLYDLPEKKGKALYNSLGTTPKHVHVKLGYFGRPFELVMEGVIDKVRAVIEEDKLVTIVKGLETGTHALQHTLFQSTFDQEVAVDQAISTFLRDLTLPSGEEVSLEPELQGLSGTLRNKVIRGENVLVALDQVASYAGAELLVVDKKIWVGNPIRDDSYRPKKFTLDSNLGAFEPFASEIPDEANRNILPRLQASSAQGFTFVVAGDPKLRPGQRVSAELDGFDQASGGEFRIHSLYHKLNATNGYVCRGRALKVLADQDPNAQRQQRAAAQPSASSLIDGISQLVTAQRRQRPTIEVGKVQTYTAGGGSQHRHSATLYFGQTYERTEIQPSLHTAVATNDAQRFPDKPVISPFAWHKCGLVTPVYPGMKAVLGHNLNLEDDVLVTGFLWSEQPAIEPPQNQPGDWWLCLPIDFDSAQPPTDSTKAANDLTANDGKRVIEVKGLKITVGAEKLGTVGARPAAGGDDEFLIEHKKAQIHIAADGSIDIVADSQGNKGKISIAASGEIRLQADGSGVALTIGPSGVQIS